MVGQPDAERRAPRCRPGTRRKPYRPGGAHSGKELVSSFLLGLQIGAAQRPALGRGPAVDPREMGEPELMAALAEAYQLGREAAESEACARDLLVFLTGYAAATGPDGHAADERVWKAYLAGCEGRGLPDAQEGTEAAGDGDGEGGPRR